MPRGPLLPACLALHALLCTSVAGFAPAAPAAQATQARGWGRPARLRGGNMAGAMGLKGTASPGAIERIRSPAYEVVYPPGRQVGDGVEAFLFDCDGTLVNSMPMWTENWARTCKQFGLDFQMSFLYRHAGKTVEETLTILCEEQGREVDPKAFLEAKEKIMAEILGYVKEITPIADVAREARGSVRMAVVSSGPREIVEELLRQTGLGDMFEFSVCAEDVQKHKPNPEPYLLAAAKLGIEPSVCRVFEDADAGMMSAASAGMEAVDVRKFAGYPDA